MVVNEDREDVLEAFELGDCGIRIDSGDHFLILPLFIGPFNLVHIHLRVLTVYDSIRSLERVVQVAFHCLVTCHNVSVRVINPVNSVGEVDLSVFWVIKIDDFHVSCAFDLE